MQNKNGKDAMLFALMMAFNIMSALYVYREINEFKQFYVFPEITLIDSQRLLTIGVWLMPKFILVSYFIKRLYEIYKVSYPYYYIRTKKPYIWLNRVLLKDLRLFVFVCIVRALIFYFISGMDGSIPDHLFIVGTELCILLTLLMISFTIYLLFENEMIYPICLALCMGAYIGGYVSGIQVIHSFMFYMNMSIAAFLAIVAIWIFLYQICVIALRKKELY